MKRGVLASLAALFAVALCVLTATGAEDALSAKQKEAMQAYMAKAYPIEQDFLARRLDLADWCTGKRLFDEAAAELGLASVGGGESKPLLDAWTKLAEQVPPSQVSATVTMADGNVLKGAVTSAPFVLKRKGGYVLVTLDSVKTMVEWQPRPAVSPGATRVDTVRAVRSVYSRYIIPGRGGWVLIGAGYQYSGNYSVNLTGDRGRLAATFPIGGFYGAADVDLWLPGKTINDEYCLVYPGTLPTPSVRWHRRCP